MTRQPYSKESGQIYADLRMLQTSGIIKSLSGNSLSYEAAGVEALTRAGSTAAHFTSIGDLLSKTEKHSIIGRFGIGLGINPDMYSVDSVRESDAKRDLEAFYPEALKLLASDGLLLVRYRPRIQRVIEDLKQVYGGEIVGKDKGVCFPFHVVSKQN